MESPVEIYEDGTFSVDLVKAELGVESAAKILQIFHHKSVSRETISLDADQSSEKQKIALPPFVLRAPEEVPLAIALIREKSEEFRHKFKLTSNLPKQYSDARLAMSILDPEVIKHIVSCFTKYKLKEMENLTKTLTNRHKMKNNTLDRYMAKLDDVPARVTANTMVLDKTKNATVKTTHPLNKDSEVLEEVKIFNKAALVTSGHSTGFRLDTAAVDIDKYKHSRKLKLKAQIRITKLRVDDLDSFHFDIRDNAHGDLADRDSLNKRLKPELHKTYLKRKYMPVECQNVEVREIRGYYGNQHETVEDIMAQFEPCSQFIVENDRTLDKYGCRVCEEKIVPKVNQTLKNALTGHYRKAHDMERHYQCERCDMILPSIDVWFLERHKTSSGCKPADLSPGLITCEKCGQKFDKNSSYRDHFKKTHTAIFRDKYKKKVECGGCGLKFTNQSMLSLHEVYEQKLCKVPCSACKELMEVKLNCKLEKVFKESGLVDSVKCNSCK